jgi:isoleucyl-tRNA synthetase
MNYRKTVNLPKTSFPMKANLLQREPEFQRRWRDMDLYHTIRKARKGCPKYTLHDGPPYASGDLHIGTGMNKILKDMVVRARTMTGHDAPYVPGWDCHGLPIEHQVLQALGPTALDTPTPEVRKRCRKFAEKHMKSHIRQFQQLGVLGDFENPYMTLSHTYERAVIEMLADLVGAGYVYKRLKPIHWCYETRTALAEAELEYEDISSPSVIVKFAAESSLRDLFPSLGDEPVSLLIWTTTPWTLPANLAIAVAEKAEYVAVRYHDPHTDLTETIVLAEDLVDVVMGRCGVERFERLERCKGGDLEGRTYRHFLNGKICPVVLASYVSLEDGTGCVHTAPGHGREDYETGLAYGLDILSPVDEAGCLTEEAGEFAGLHVFDADPKIVARLRELGVLLMSEEITHSYPHCWRSKKPVIFRATEQWFVSVDHNGLRQAMLDAIQQVNWIPDWGQGRITAMVSERPDWCISRQRSWGIPIPAFYCTACGASLMTRDSLLLVADLFGREGSDAWFQTDPCDILADGTACESCGGTAFRKETDILDVWFESGSSHRAVLKTTPGLEWPADLYLEGTDQHRGWFQLSMLPAVATDGAPPFREVLTHGFVVDEKGEKMSKSLGNFISVADALGEFGAEMQRLWTASVDYRTDIQASREIIQRLNEPYRRYRNTFRYLLGNLSDFDPNRDAVDVGDVHEIDRLMLSRTQQLIADVRRSYEEHQFYRVFQRTYGFCTVDLSSFYLDVIKDRLYCEAADAPTRRSAQTVMDAILNALTRLLAPILVHTCEDVWDAMPHREDLPSVHLAMFPEARTEWIDEALEAKWDSLLSVRDEACRELEKLRAAKEIGSALDARVTLYAEGDLLQLLAANAALLPETFICSEVDVVEGTSDEAVAAAGMDGLAVAVEPSTRHKCVRCWRLLPSVGADAEHPELCGRCAGVVRALPNVEDDES